VSRHRSDHSASNPVDSDAAVAIAAPAEFATLVDLLCWRAMHQPDQQLYTFLVDGETKEASLTLRELDRRSRAIAARLQQLGAPGDRALLLYPPGLEYICAFFGCLYAGMVAVPAYPPNPARLDRTLPRLQAMMHEARPSIVLTTASILPMARLLAMGDAAFQAVRWLATDDIAAGAEDAWQKVPLTSETLAFLQYTSGSTATPKGVMLAHARLLHNSALIQQCFAHSPQSRGVAWLPPYHDMGLIGGILQPLYSGFPVILLSPVAFIQRPLCWLQAVSRYKATTSGGPNFAYDLCVRKTSPEQRATLDLSNWKTAFNGAEPIRAETLDRFAEAFAPCGFRREAFYPCYGLAEATLIVAGGDATAKPNIGSFQAEALEKGQVVESRGGQAGARALVSSGQSVPGQQIIIVDPTTRMPCQPTTVGEIWVAGPSVADGYWNRSEETQATFQAVLADCGQGPFLRTGDLGFIQNGELFVTGRLKDMMLIRGRNFYPQDIEQTVERSHPMLRPGCAAAFSIDVDNEERLVIVQEVDRHYKPEQKDQIIRAIRGAVAEAHEVHVYALALLKQGQILKTSSGKIQRRACRSAFLHNDFVLLASSTLSEEPMAQVEAQLTRADLLAAEPAEHPKLIGTYLQQQVGRILQIEQSAINMQNRLTSLGADSLMTIELQHRLEADLGVTISIADLLQDISIAEVASRALAELEALPTHRATPPPAPADVSMHPLSYGQKALWFLHQLAPESSAYNIVSALRLSTAIDLEVLRQAFQTVVDRHTALRTTISIVKTEPMQFVHADMQVWFQHEDASAWSIEQINQRMAEAAYQPFDLERGPLLRVYLFSRSSHEHFLLLAIHHIVADFWSLALLAHELNMLLQAQQTSAAPVLPSVTLQFSDYVHFQTTMLANDGERFWKYWQQQLAGPLPVLELPTAQPRPPVQTYRGASQGCRLGPDLAARLVALARTHHVTLYTLLLAAFQVYLHRSTSQEDLLVGSPAAARTSAEFASVFGYFVNPLVMRTRLSGAQPFSTVLAQVSQTVLEALAHQEYPFALLAERLQPNRDASRHPLFQVLFSFQRAQLRDVDPLAAFALGETGVSLDLGKLHLETVALEQRRTPFDLALMMAEHTQELYAAFQYNSDLFQGDTITRMLQQFQLVLERIVVDPDRCIANISLLTVAERRQVLVSWNATKVAISDSMDIPSLFEVQVRETPDAIAVVFEDSLLTYAELNRRANQMAHHLRGYGVGPDSLVGVCVPRSLDLLIGLLGVLKAGGAYVPLDPSYPQARLGFMLEDAQVSALLVDDRFTQHLPPVPCPVIRLGADRDGVARQSGENPSPNSAADRLMYVMYTSGSTGKPKGVMITQRSVVNFFAGMDQRVGCDRTDTVLAVTSISFDISVLELFWPLVRGARVILVGEHAAGMSSNAQRRSVQAKPIQFSLFFFASDSTATAGDKYRLLFDGAKFADRHGFSAIWTPERHFHAFGGLYPNPSVLSAALAAVTQRIQIRAGSVVMPLHHPIRVAEEWALVDNISNGRVGIAFASGWHADDFVFFPEHYADRRAVTQRSIEVVQQLWQGQGLTVRGGAGNELQVTLFPRPIQANLPIWLTAAVNPETFIKAGEIGAAVLTHLLGQTVEDVASNIRRYRESLVRHGHDPNAGHVTLMLHTFIGEDRDAVREQVREPFTRYLRSSVGLIENLVNSLQLPLDLQKMSPADMDALLAFAFDRYFETSALFGTPETCLAMIEDLKAIGVDEVACLIDFGIDVETTLRALNDLNRLRELSNAPSARVDFSISAQAADYQATLMQCTPSLMHMLLLNTGTLEPFRSLHTLLLGGEPLSPALVQKIHDELPCRLLNMYGPTETTIWSACHEITDAMSAAIIGRPIANTQIYLLDQYRHPVPIGVPGEVCIGGDGLARGYLNRNDLTSERFLQISFDNGLATHMYLTGDMARYLPDGTIEFLGRRDQQIKLRGFRIELEEIEAVISQHAAIRSVVVLVREDSPGDKRLVAYVVVEAGDVHLIGDELRQLLRSYLPEYMVPSLFIPLERMPLTPNGKIDRAALAAYAAPSLASQDTYVAPQSTIEELIAAVWREVLKFDQISIYDNFFDLGGHSLLLAQVHSQLQEQLQREISLITLLEYPTISTLAAHLEQEPAESALQRSFDLAQRQRSALQRRRQLASV
jgi:natural product biosynthesis luciferase-like monooxygenase protein